MIDNYSLIICSNDRIKVRECFFFCFYGKQAKILFLVIDLKYKHNND